MGKSVKPKEFERAMSGMQRRVLQHIAPGVVVPLFTIWQMSPTLPLVQTVVVATGGGAGVAGLWQPPGFTSDTIYIVGQVRLTKLLVFTLAGPGTTEELQKATSRLAPLRAQHSSAS